MDADVGSRVFRLADFSDGGAFGLVIVGPVSRLSLFRPVLGKRRPRREAAAALVASGLESEGVGYPGLSLAAVRRTRSWYGQALERWRRTRRVLRMTTAPIFRSLRRIVSA